MARVSGVAGAGAAGMFGSVLAMVMRFSFECQIPCRGRERYCKM